MKVRFSTRTAWGIVAGVMLAWLGCFVFAIYLFYRWNEADRFQVISSGMYREVCADIIDPLESKYRIRRSTFKVRSNDTIGLRIELNPNEKDQAQAFDIAREVYELKQKSPVLSKRPLELKLWVHDPAVDGQRIVSVNPDSRYGVNLHVLMPGAPDHKKKRDLEEYLELTRKWEEIHRQEEMEKRREEEMNERKASIKQYVDSLSNEEVRRILTNMLVNEAYRQYEQDDDYDDRFY